MSELKPGSVEDIFTAFGELFGQFFAGGSHHIGTTLELTDAEAAEGCVKQVEIQRRSPCVPCNGRGTATVESAAPACPKCAGKGSLQHAQGFFMVQTTCATCKGHGAIIKDPCKACDGARAFTVPAQVTVQVPPGIEHAATLRVTGAGSKLVDGTVGDLNVFVLVGGRPDPRAAAFEHVALPAELPQARLHEKQRPIAWTAIGIVVAVVFALILLAR